MLNRWFQPKAQKVLTAITRGERDTLLKFARGKDWPTLLAELSEHNLLLIAVESGQPEALRVLLENKAQAEDTDQLYISSLNNAEHSLKFVSHLLQHKVPAPQNIWDECLLCLPETKQQMHLSRFFEHGILPANPEAFVAKVIETNRNTLIYFAVSSLKLLPTELCTLSCTDEAKAYAERCLKDIQVREALSPF